MNKRYKFKFESVLKLKRFHEDKVKNELGTLEKARQSLVNEIEQTTQGIQTYYHEQEIIANGAKMRELLHYPQVIWSNVAKRKNLQQKLLQTSKLVEEKQLELARARGEVKVFEKLREEDFKEFKLKVEKVEDQEREENFQMRSFYLNRLEGEK